MNSIRLNELAAFVESNDKLADIGCDHGYLCILAIKKGVTFLQLIDNKIGPLKSSIKNLRSYSIYNDKKININYTLSSGLKDLLPEIDTITLAGMGGKLIIKILNDDFEKAKKLQKIIIQANTDLYLLREYLDNNNLKIINEKIICESEKYYEIIVACYDENHLKGSLSDDEKFFGPLLLMERSQTFLDKWNRQLMKLESIKAKQKASEKNIDEKINYIKSTLKF